MRDTGELHNGGEGSWVRRGVHRYGNYSEALGGGLFVNVVDGKVRSLGIEPVGELLVDARHKVVGAIDDAVPQGRLALERVAMVGAVAIGSLAGATVWAGRWWRRRAA